MNNYRDGLFPQSKTSNNGGDDMEWMTPKDVAEMWGVKRSHVYYLRNKGIIKPKERLIDGVLRLFFLKRELPSQDPFPQNPTSGQHKKTTKLEQVPLITGQLGDFYSVVGFSETQIQELERIRLLQHKRHHSFLEECKQFILSGKRTEIQNTNIPGYKSRGEFPIDLNKQLPPWLIKRIEEDVTQKFSQMTHKLMGWQLKKISESKDNGLVLSVGEWILRLNLSHRLEKEPPLKIFERYIGPALQRFQQYDILIKYSTPQNENDRLFLTIVPFAGWGNATGHCETDTNNKESITDIIRKEVGRELRQILSAYGIS